MMKNKIAIGLGLMLSLTAGASFADDSEGVLQVSSEEISPSHAGKIDTSSLAASKDASIRYDITCDAYNLHQEKGAHLLITPVPFPQVNMGPVLLNDQVMNGGNNGFRGKLQADETPGSDSKNHNKIVFQQFVIQGDSAANTYINVQEVEGYSVQKSGNGLSGFVLQNCTYKSVQGPASNGTPKKPKDKPQDNPTAPSSQP